MIHIEFGGAMVKIPDTKINWRRRLGVQIFKDRGDVGPQKIYINPFIAPISESRRHQKKFKSLFLDKKLDFKGVGQGTSVGSSVTWVIQSSSLSTIFDTAIRFALEPLFEDDLGNTRGIIEKYNFEHPVWFNVVHQIDIAYGGDDESRPELFWQNCVVDWYEMRRYIELKTLKSGDVQTDLVSPFNALKKVCPRVKLFADGRMLSEENEFIYLTEIST